MSSEDRHKHQDAIRQAKVIVSDIKLYHGDLVETALANNAIVKLIGPNIKDSWKIYKQRVPADIVETTNYFREALNEIICNGQKTF